MRDAALYRAVAAAACAPGLLSRARDQHLSNLAWAFAAAAQAAYASPAARDDRGLRRSVSTILSEFDSNGKHDGLLSRPLLVSARSRSSGYHKKV